MRHKKIIYVIILSLFWIWVLTLKLSSNITEQYNTEFILHQVEITAYSPSPHITDNNPFQMASGKIATPQDLEQLRFIGISRDLIKQYELEFGDIVYIGFEFQDVMNVRITNSLDLFMRNLDLARKWGRQERSIIIIRGE